MALIIKTKVGELRLDALRSSQQVLITMPCLKCGDHKVEALLDQQAARTLASALETAIR